MRGELVAVLARMDALTVALRHARRCADRMACIPDLRD